MSLSSRLIEPGMNSLNRVLRMTQHSIREEELFIRIEWFVKLRWLFLIGLAVTILTANQVFKLEFNALDRIIIIAVVVFTYNLALHFYHVSLGKRLELDPKKMRAEANLQISLDLLALTFLIHYSGSVENPFVFFYLFHAIIGSILLPRSDVWIQGMAISFIFMVMVTLEYFGVIPHYHLEGFLPADLYQDFLYVSVICIVLLATLATTIYMSSTIVQGLRVREMELFLTRNILERKSRDLEEANIQLKDKQKQLVQAEKLASLGGLVSGIAHEINNPIQFIRGNMQIISESTDDILPILDTHAENHPGLKLARLEYPFFRQQIRVLIDDMSNGADRIKNIVADLKTFAREDEGRMDEDVDLNEVVRACERLVYNKIKHHRMEKNLDPALPKIKGNVNRIEQVVIATLINAAEALADSSDGIIKIATRTENDGKGVVLSISDNGPGITEEVKSRIFDPFFSTKQRAGGTGLGLSVTYGIIEDHKGRIELQTEVGKGAAFIYHLPVDWSSA